MEYSIFNMLVEETHYEMLSCVMNFILKIPSIESMVEEHLEQLNHNKDCSPQCIIPLAHYGPQGPIVWGHCKGRFQKPR